jgi:hypothetical protein
VPRDKCPRVKTDPSLGFGGDYPNTTFTLTDRQGFFADIFETWGIEEEWIKFDKRRMSLANGCQFEDEHSVNDYIAWTSLHFHDFPILDGGKVKIHNPKDIISKALPDARGLLNQYRDIKTFAEFEDDLDMFDLTDAGSLPAFGIEEAVVQMEKIVEEANEIAQRLREEFILNMILGFLFFIPFIGPTGGSAVAAGVRSLLRLIGTAGKAGTALYGVVSDPDNAFITVLSTLIGAGFNRGGFRSTANSRRTISTKEYESLGNIKPKLDRINHVRNGMCSL